MAQNIQQFPADRPVASATSELGTPRLTPIIISGLEGPDGDDWPTSQSGLNSDSPQFHVIRAVQTWAEIYQIGDTRGSSSYFTVICRDSSIPYDSGDSYTAVGNTVTKLQSAVRALEPVGDYDFSDCTVVVGLLSDDDTDNSF